MHRVVIIHADGQIESFVNQSPPSLEKLQALVGGYVTMLRWPSDRAVGGSDWKCSA